MDQVNNIHQAIKKNQFIYSWYSKCPLVWIGGRHELFDHGSLR